MSYNKLLHNNVFRPAQSTIFQYKPVINSPHMFNYNKQLISRRYALLLSRYHCITNFWCYEITHSNCLKKHNQQYANFDITIRNKKQVIALFRYKIHVNMDEEGLIIGDIWRHDINTISVTSLAFIYAQCLLKSQPFPCLSCNM